MSPADSAAQITLSYPLYSADFAEDHPGFLVVAGGGGEGKSGIPNKITLLEASAPTSLRQVADIDLSRDEDSIQSLATIASKDGLIALAGINSSRAEQVKGNNDHLRAFNIRFEGTKDEHAGADISFIAKSAIFETPQDAHSETYQRIIRLSPSRSKKYIRIAAIATGSAKNPELVILQASKSLPVTTKDIITRITLSAEAAGLDIAITPEGACSVCWCTSQHIYEQSVTYRPGNPEPELNPKSPRRILSALADAPFTGQATAVSAIPAVTSAYRSVRFLTSHHVLILSNKPKRTGSELSILHLYPTGPATLVFRKTLPARIKQGTALDVCALDPDAQGSRQFVIAVGGQDNSISTYTADYHRSTDTFGPLSSYKTFREVHKFPMTALTFALFSAATQPKNIQLASVGVGNTVVVHTFAVSPLDPQHKNSRHVLSRPGGLRNSWVFRIALLSLLMLLIAILLQAYSSPESVALLTRNNPSKLYENVVGTKTASIERRIRDSLRRHQRELAANANLNKGLVLQTGTDVTVHEAHQVSDKKQYLAQNKHVKHWHELSDEDKRRWKAALVKAGDWAVEEGEAVFKGVLFGSYAQAVGQAFAQAAGA